jgi:hypothetical protein
MTVCQPAQQEKKEKRKRATITGQRQYSNTGLFDAELKLSPTTAAWGPWSPTISVICVPPHIQDLETHDVYYVRTANPIPKSKGCLLKLLLTQLQNNWPNKRVFRPRRLTCPVIAIKTLRPHIRVPLKRIGRSSYCFFSYRNKSGCL